MRLWLSLLVSSFQVGLEPASVSEGFFVIAALEPSRADVVASIVCNVGFRLDFTLAVTDFEVTE